MSSRDIWNYDKIYNPHEDMQNNDSLGAFSEILEEGNQENQKITLEDPQQPWEAIAADNPKEPTYKVLRVSYDDGSLVSCHRVNLSFDGLKKLKEVLGLHEEETTT